MEIQRLPWRARWNPATPRSPWSQDRRDPSGAEQQRDEPVRPPDQGHRAGDAGAAGRHRRPGPLCGWTRGLGLHPEGQVECAVFRSCGQSAQNIPLGGVVL